MSKEQLLAKAMNQHYLIVQDNAVPTSGSNSRGKGSRADGGNPSGDWARLPKDVSKVPAERLINGDESYYSKMENETVATHD